MQNNKISNLKRTANIRELVNKYADKYEAEINKNVSNLKSRKDLNYELIEKVTKMIMNKELKNIRAQ